MPDYTIPNLKNACRILEHLSLLDGAPTSATIADSLRIPRSTTLRILFTLEKEGFVDRHGNAYTLGPSLIPLGQRSAERQPIIDLSSPILAQITRETGETAQLATLSGSRSLILKVEASPHPLSAHSTAGTLAYVHCSASGKAILAHLRPDSLKAALPQLDLQPRTQKTITTLSALENELATIRAKGYSVDEQEYYDGVRCLAAPIFDEQGYATHAIGITASATRFTKSKLPQYSKLIRQAAQTLTQKTGGQLPS